MRLFPEKETLNIEFKSDRKCLEDSALIDAVVGIANTEGGTLYVGIEDDGTITGISKNHADETGVIALIANKTVPPLSVRANLVSGSDFQVLKIEIPKSKSIISTSDGKILRRRLKIDGTPENIPMYSYELNTRLSELDLLDYSAQIIQEADYSDLDSVERQKLRDIIRTQRGDKYLLELSDEELDKALFLVKDEAGILKPTVTGMLLIGKEEKIKSYIPTAKASIQILSGSSVKVNEQLSKSLISTFEVFESYFKAWNSEKEFSMGLYRIPVPDFSYSAFREGLLNAFCHRDYSILQSVRMLIEDEGLTISSPGGFIDGVNMNNLLTTEPHGRNHALSDALKRIGLVERTGRGIDRIFEGSIIYGRPLPDYSESTERCVKLFIARTKPDIDFVKMISTFEKENGKSLGINSLLILSVLQQKKASFSRLELCEKLHISEQRLGINIENLLHDGLIEELSNGKLHLKSGDKTDENNSAEYYETLILEYLSINEYISREIASSLWQTDADKTYRLLRKLVDSGKIKPVGKGRGAKYTKSQTP